MMPDNDIPFKVSEQHQFTTLRPVPNMQLVTEAHLCELAQAIYRSDTVRS